MRKNQPVHDYVKIETNLISLNKLQELLINDEEIEKFDNIIIQLDIKLSLVDFCYPISKKHRLDSTKAYVVKSSLLENHEKIIKSVLSLINFMHQDLRKNSTIYACCKNILKYIRWSLAEGFPQTLDQAKHSFIEYLNYLRNEMALFDKSKNLGISSFNARAKQNNILLFFSELFKQQCDKSFFENGVKLISENPNQLSSTKSINVEELANQFTFYTQVFRQFASILLTSKSLPLKVSLLEKDIWLSPYSGAIFTESKKGGAAFNYNEGRFYSVDELCTLYSVKRHKANAILSKGNEALQRSQKVDSKVRKLLIGYALKAYFMHFLFLTGMNDSAAAQIYFSDNYDFSKSSIHFTSIKLRANGKKVNFDIQSEFKADFLLYLRLREHVLNNFEHSKKVSSRLFLASVERKVRVHPLQGGASYKSRQNLSSAFNIDFLHATSRMIRVSKGVWVRKKYGSSVSAWSLQHSINTNARHYSGKDDETTSQEMTSFFHVLTDNIKKENNLTSTSIGKCSDLYKPQLTSTDIDETELSCSKLQTCLFCSNYRLHTDELDMHKLLSLKYLIMEGQSLAYDSEHFKSVFGVYLKRIEELLGAVKNSNPKNVELIESISNKVFKQGILTSYWQRKLELYINIGLL